ncbi:unnamed protein product [Rhizopus stolonifer]
MSSSLEQEKKKTQRSRKGKKAWRKNVDISDVIKGQEELRAVERVFGHTGEKKDDELFTIDVQGDSASIKTQMAKEKPLRVDEILNQRSAVPAVKAKNPFKKPEMTDKLASKHESENVQKMLKRKGNDTVTQQKKKKKTNAPDSYDLWGSDSVQEESSNDYLPKIEKPKAPASLKRKPTALTVMPAIETPHKGTSYNPEAEAHQQLIVEAVKIEERKADIVAKLQEQLSYREELKKLADEESQTIEEDDIKDDDDKSLIAKEEESLEDKATDDKETKKRKAAERKTRRDRNKESRLVGESIVRRQKLHEKSIRKQIDKLRDIEAEIQKKEEELDALAVSRSEQKEIDAKKGYRKIGKYQVPELPVDVQLTDELCATLRQLKPEGNIFKDRFNSILKRNIIETRVPVKPYRKYGLKEYEKRSYKQFDQNEERKKKQAKQTKK